MTAGKRGKDGRATELACEAVIIETAMKAGWLVHGSRTTQAAREDGSHFHATHLKGHPGFPDLLLLHPGRAEILVIELKRTPNHATAEQQVWLAGFEACDIPARVMYVPEQQQILLDYLVRRPKAPVANKG